MNVGKFLSRRECQVIVVVFVTGILHIWTYLLPRGASGRTYMVFVAERFSTVAGIYRLRRLQIKSSGRLSPKAVLTLDC